VLTAGEEATREARQHAWRLDVINKYWMDLGHPPWSEASRTQYPLGFGPGQTLTGPDRARLAAYVDSFVGPVEPVQYACDA
jgi:hypothetical protein